MDRNKRLTALLDSFQLRIDPTVCGGWLVTYVPATKLPESDAFDSILADLQQTLLPLNLRAATVIGNINEQSRTAPFECVRVIGSAIVLRTTLREEQLRSLIESLGLQWGDDEGSAWHTEHGGFWTFIIPPGVMAHLTLRQLLFSEGIVEAFFISAPSCSAVTYD